MARPLRQSRVTTLAEPISDFSLGIVDSLSDAQGVIRHVKKADNAVFDDPLRSLGVRPGYGDVVGGVLPYPPHSLMMFYSASANRCFVGAGAKVYEIVDGGGYVEQALPALTDPYTSNRWSHTNINGVLIAAQEGGQNPPICFDGTSWRSTALPTPPAGLAAGVAVGGSVDVGEHKWRVRWLFTNGSGLACASVAATTTSGNQTVSLSGIPLSSRSDFIGWQLERTKLGEPDLWYVVEPFGSKSSSTYDDTVADATLGDLVGAEPGVHGAAPHFEGVVAFKDRLIGWTGTSIYCSQAIGDEEGSGVFNFKATNQYPVKAGDGDDIVLCLEQADRLLILKGQRAHALLGYDPESFQIVTVPGALGCASTRGATAHGAAVWYYAGFGRIMLLNGDRVSQAGKTQVGGYLSEIEPTDDDEVVMANDGQRVFMAYRGSGSDHNDQLLAFNVPHGQWEHHTNMRVADMLFPKRRTLFSGARMLFADPKVVESRSLGGGGGTSLQQSFFLFMDRRPLGTEPAQYYAQSLDSTGVPLWATDGLQVSANETYEPYGIVGVPDASGGLITFSVENRSGTIGLVAHRISAAGSHLWSSTSGIWIIGAAGWAWWYVRATPDGTGGAIVAWADTRTPAASEVYVQRIDANGNQLWGAGGVKVSSGGVSWRYQYPSICPDGSGGCYVSWRYYDGSATPTIYCQRVDSSGILQWTTGGIVVSTDLRLYDRPAMCQAKDNAVIFACQAVVGALKAVKVSSAGAILWTSANLTVGFASAGNSEVVSDDAGGAILVFQRTSGGSGAYSSYAVRVLSTGVAAWAGPIELMPIAKTWDAGDSSEGGRAVVQDGSGGAIIAAYAGAEVWAQGIDLDGNLMMGTGLLVHAVLGSSSYDRLGLVSDGAGGSVASWKLSLDQNLRAGRIEIGGATSWVVAVAPIVYNSGDVVQHAAFRGAVDGQVPFGGEAGYHVWSGWDGQADERAVGESTGTPIPWVAELPDYDSGAPDLEKEFDRILIVGDLDGAELTAGIVIGSGPAAAAVPIAVVGSGSRWGSKAEVPTADTLIWNQGRWASSRATETIGPLPAGLCGKRARLRLSGQLSRRPKIASYVLDFHLLPDRGY